MYHKPWSMPSQDVRLHERQTPFPITRNRSVPGTQESQGVQRYDYGSGKRAGVPMPTQVPTLWLPTVPAAAFLGQSLV